MKVIILSCNTGEGHNTAGNAIIEGMRARGVEADMVNALELMGVKRSKLICGTYIKMVRKLPGAVRVHLQSGAADLHTSLQIGALLRQ